MQDTRYYLLVGGSRRGSYSSSRIYDLYTSGQIGGSTLCCERTTLKADPFAPWVPISKIIRHIYPGSAMKEVADDAGREEIAASRNTGAIVTVIGAGAALLFLFGALAAADNSPGIAAEQTPFLQAAFQAAGFLAGALLALGGLLTILRTGDHDRRR